jgi:hypothetical protein
MSGIGFQENSVSETGQKRSPFSHLCPPREQNCRSEISPDRQRPFKRIFQGIFGLALLIPISLTALFLSVAAGATNLQERFNPSE